MSNRINQKKNKSWKICISCESALNDDQRKSFCENYNSIAVWLWLVSKFTENTNSKKVSYLPWQRNYPKLENYLKNFFLWIKSLQNLLLAKYLLSVTATLILSVTFFRKNSSWIACSIKIYTISREFLS